MSKTDKFDWVEFYEELASNLLKFKNNRSELVEKIIKIYEATDIKMPILEKDDKLVDIDPFTVFGLFNKSSINEINKLKIISAIAKIFDISAPIPTSFDSIPLLDNRFARFYNFIGTRGENDIDDLWELFSTAIAYASKPTIDNRTKLSKYFDLNINKKGNGNGKITIGLYWISSGSFINLDQRNTWYIYESGKLPAELVNSLPEIKSKISFEKYFDLIEKNTHFPAKR